jgi:steroid delta-isomerase-like uncharacterized protein
MVATQERMVNVDQNKELVRRAYDARNRGAAGEFGNLLSEDFRELTQRGNVRSKMECIAEIEALRRVMPDVRYDIQDMIAEGDTVAVVENYSGTMKGEMMGLKPTGKRMSVTAVDVYKIKDGKLAEVRSVFDTAYLIEQLGIK